MVRVSRHLDGLIEQSLPDKKRVGSCRLEACALRKAMVFHLRQAPATPTRTIDRRPEGGEGEESFLLTI